MRYWSAFVVVVLGAGCTDPVPTGETGASPELLASVQSALVPPTVFNTQMRTELESPACPRPSSPGHAQIMVLEDGTIESKVMINNKGEESVRFGHIHHLNPGQPTGPIIWWLTTPVGTDLNITDRHIDIRQLGIFVTNPHFTTEGPARAELLADPGSFYVNFHSDACPGGFTRGFLP